MSKNKKSSKADGAIPSSEQLGESTLPAVRSGPSVGVLAAVSASAEASTKVRRLTLPPIIPPAKVGPGVAIEGTILRVIPSPKAAYKSEILVMRHPSGQEFCWPANAVTVGALANEQKVKRDAVDLQKSVGLHLIIKGLGSKPMEGIGSDGRPRTVNLYEVFVVED